jgi:hypothetical protein
LSTYSSVASIFPPVIAPDGIIEFIQYKVSPIWRSYSVARSTSLLIRLYKSLSESADAA